MNAFAISGIITAVFTIVFAFFVFWETRRVKINRVWSLFCLSVSVWGAGVYKIATTLVAPEALFWWRMTHIGVIFIPILFLHYVYLFLKIERKKTIIVFYTFGIIFTLLDVFSDLFIANVRFVFNSFYYDSPPTKLYVVFIILWFATIIYAHYELFRNYRRIFGIKREQIKYFFMAMVVSFGGGSTCFLPVFGIDLYPIFNFTTPLYPLIMAYAIMRYRLMNISIVVRQTTIYLFSFLSITIICLAAFLFLEAIFYVRIDYILFTINIFILFFLLILFFPLKNFFKNFANKHFFTSLYNKENILKGLIKNIPMMLDIDQLIDLIVNTSKHAFYINEIAIYTFNSSDKKFIALKSVGFKKRKLNILIKNKQLYEHLYKIKAPLLLNDLEKQRDLKRVFLHNKLINLFIDLQIELIAPLVIKNNIIGILILGPKLNKIPFYKDDMETLKIITNQASIAIENALLYEEVLNFNKKMEEEVRHKTKSLRSANIKLKQIDKAKSEFISIASHQLRTPLTSVKGYISMMLEGSFGKINKRAYVSLENVYKSNERLIKLVEELLSVSRIELGRMVFEFKKIDFNAIVESVVEELLVKAKQKGIFLVFEKKNLSKVDADELKIRQVIVNLIDNAIKYTKSGGVKIYSKLDNQKKPKFLYFFVNDSGIGVEKQNTDIIFDKFIRGKGTFQIDTEGVGLGLYISRKIIEAHDGEIGLESKGKGKGSTFWIKIPIEHKKITKNK